MDSIASFTSVTGGQKGHMMWILTNQQRPWLPSEKMLWNPTTVKSPETDGLMSLLMEGHKVTLLLKIWFRFECAMKG